MITFAVVNDWRMKLDSLDRVTDLIAGKEGGQVEFKKTTGQLKRGMETLCAFLNGAGGTVLFGVTDDSEVLGQEVSDKTKREIAEAIRSSIPPGTAYELFSDTFGELLGLPQHFDNVSGLHRLWDLPVSAGF